ncbi:DNA cytosine methyltransferase [Blastococcus saxobsidens]|uniref:Cytosine-specific methyltransferase n=1 Tax=Blastococcus saxobsidens (strain DD2) TaxID=1146883 RepID=H6RTV7_BLASD|nr:DNA cytosine methyltransferase [Blastococcus saxobsidens]CCG04367.1 DNA-methyltransferase Dcm [Blastococcus saxobsidens DD2]
MRESRFTLLDLFAGCGGMTRGFLGEGNFIGVGAVEIDRTAAATYAANFDVDGRHIFAGDIAGYTDVPRADLVVGGPPCQGFSALGRRDPADARNQLWREFVRVVRESDARMFVFENVDRFAKTPEFQLLRQTASEDGELADFDTQVFRLNAADYGTPQKRIRTIVVGSRVGPVDEPRQTHAKTPGGDLDRWVGLREAFLEGPVVLEPEVRETWLPESLVEFQGHDIPGTFKLRDLHITRNYDLISEVRYAHIAPGKGRFDLPDELQYPCWRRHTRGAGDVLGRLQWDEPAVTIRTEFFRPEKGRFLHPQWENGGDQVNRALTHAEAAVVQGFDDRHLWCGTKAEIARQIGNAVPPPLARAVAHVVAARLAS